MAEARKRAARYLRVKPSDNAQQIDLLNDLAITMSTGIQAVLFNFACLLEVLNQKGIITQKEMDQAGNELRASQALGEALLEIQDAENRVREAQEGTSEEEQKEEEA